MSNDQTDKKETALPLLESFYPQFLSYLKTLVNYPSVFSHRDNVLIALEYCKKVLSTNLPHYSIYFDSVSNLIAVPTNIDKEKPVIYHNAHIDTADVEANEWDYPYQPFNCFEDEQEMIGRGVSDCKAGVAYQLWLSYLQSKGLLSLQNVIFTITCKEEGSGEKTAVEIGKQLGKKLPISDRDTYLFVLENTISIGNLPNLGIYTAERCSYAIKVTGTLPELQQMLTKLTHWNPVSIAQIFQNRRPRESGDPVLITQPGGHVCSIAREDNKLVSAIFEAKPNAVISAGKENNFGVIPTEITISEGDESINHTLVLSNRSFDSREEVEKQLHGITYKEMKDFNLSTGNNWNNLYENHSLVPLLKDIDSPNLPLSFSYNVGASDATTIYNSMNESEKKYFYPLVMGPGTRSQREAIPPRLTHGKNETFDKKMGLQAITFITKVLQKILK